jgi:hypothetical protein
MSGNGEWKSARRARSACPTGPGASGREWSNRRSSARLNVPKTALARLGPASPTLIFSERAKRRGFTAEPSGAWNQYGKWSAGVLEYWGAEATEASCVDFRGKNYGFLRIFPRFFTIFRTDQGRIYAILRIFTGGTNF